METQAQGQETSQVQAPVHAIDQEQGILNRLSNLVGGDNDPDQGTDLEGTQVETKVQPSTETPAEPSKEAVQETEPPIEFDEEAPLFELEYKGDNGVKEVKKLSYKELREGYLAKADYHRNIQKVKQQEQEVQKKVQEATLQAQSQYLTQLEVYKQAVVKAVAPELQNVDLNKLSLEDPARAQQIFFKQLQFNSLLQNIDAEQRQAQERFQNEQRAALTKVVEESRQTLERDLPGWSDETYKTVLTNMVSEYGFNPNEVSQVVDARLIKVFHDANQYRQLQKAKPQVEKKVVNLPKVLKPGSSEKQSPVAEAETEARNRLRKTGDLRDAANLYLARQQKRK